MCGIAGVYGAVDEVSVARMVDVQIHRGPDDRGIWSDPAIPATLGHCRLSIIDLSREGHQPMSYDDGRLWITYNGEIYNFSELRIELEGVGHRFHSNSDTEIILAAYCEWGPSCVKKFRGMFAFALIDKHPPKGAPNLLLARDRLGIKPLVYFERGFRLFFASELCSLLESGQVDRTIDPDALLDYLASGSVYQPRTILKGVKAVPAGHYMAISGNERQLVSYWDLHEETCGLRKELQSITFSEAVERLKVLLHDAARYNMVSDVPVGAFLSGGIDSTAVVGFMGEVNGNRIRTFSVGFESTHQAIDERFYARMAAKHLGSKHEEVIVTSREAYELFTKVVANIDQPSFDGINTWIVSRVVRQSVKVAVSGLGGDELFAGYTHFRWLAEDAKFCHNKFPVVYSALENIHRMRPNRITLRLLFKYATPAERLSMLRRILDNFEIKNAVRPEWSESFRRRLIDRYEKSLKTDADKVQQTSYAEINGYLLSTLLRDADVMSMAHGLEIRPMLLDHPLVEFAYSLPSAYKLGRVEAKRVFIEAASEHLPTEIRTRPKMGFELPIIDWMAGELKLSFGAFLGSETARKIFQPSYIKSLACSLRQGKPPRALWAWGILLSWMDKHRIKLN